LECGALQRGEAEVRPDWIALKHPAHGAVAKPAVAIVKNYFGCG
jgi:hypothetical protein